MSDELAVKTNDPILWTENTVDLNRATIPSFYFTGSSGRHLMIIRPDGTLEIGGGLSADEATQEVAKQLVKHFANQVCTELQSLKDENWKLKDCVRRLVAWENPVEDAAPELEGFTSACQFARLVLKEMK